MLFWKGGRSKSRKTGSLQTWPISAIRMKILNLVLKKRWDLLKIFLLKTDIVWSFDSQLQLNCQQIHHLHEIHFHFWMNRRTDVSSVINWWNGWNQDSLINETIVSSISTNWSIQSISIFIDLSIDEWFYQFLSIDYSR